MLELIYGELAERVGAVREGIAVEARRPARVLRLPPLVDPRGIARDPRRRGEEVVGAVGRDRVHEPHLLV
jgi:hypothetical protein